jgi:anthranilate phosphoribosyltransferase
MNNQTLKAFGENIQRLINKEDLSKHECYLMFKQILCNLQPDLHQGAFLAALTSKGETPQEIAGAWKAIVDYDTVKINKNLGSLVFENSGTGMDQLKTFNVSSAAGIVAAAHGVRLARHGSRALTSSCGTVDILESIGLNVSCDVSLVQKSIINTNIGLFNGMSHKIHQKSLARILSQIRFGSTLNIAASLASPYQATHALRGVFSQDIVKKVAGVMKEIGYEKGLVVHGKDDHNEGGIDELSTIGESIVYEFSSDRKDACYTITPEDVGLTRTTYDKIASTGDINKERVRFLEVISGKRHEECIDITCFNAGAILYTAGKATDIQKGVHLSKEIIKSGKALKKLSQWICIQSDSLKNGVRQYIQVAKKAHIENVITQHIDECCDWG